MTNMGWESYDEKLDALLRGGAATWRLLEEIRADLDFIVANTRQIRNELRKELRAKLNK